MDSLKGRFCKKLFGRAGTSFAELLICVALLSLVSLIAVSGLMYAYRSADKIQLEAEAWEVGGTILNRIEGELNGMLSAGNVYLEKDPASGSGKYEVIAFNSSSGVPIYITAQDKRLLVHYRETKTSATTTVKESEWTFDEYVYHGYTVESLLFSCSLRGNKLVVKAELELESPNGKSFMLSRTTGCFNKNLVDIYDSTMGIDNTKFTKAELLSDSAYWST